MSSSLHTSSFASVAGAKSASWRRDRLDSFTGNRGFCPPTLFRRIGITRQTTATPSRSDRATPPATGYGWTTAKLLRARMLPARTTLACIGSGPADAPQQARLDNRKRMKAAKPSSRPIDRASAPSSFGGQCRSQHRSHREPGGEPMSARASPTVR